MSKELKVGAFVLAALAILLGTLIYVEQLGGARVPYRTYFTYVGGVNPGSPVRFGGVKAGSITAIHPWHEDPTRIEVLLEVNPDLPVNADSVAMLTSVSPLGDKYLEISTGSNKAPRLPHGATIPSVEPVSLDDLARQVSAMIPTVQTTLQSVQKDIDQLTRNAQVVMANVQAMTGPQNQRNFTLLLANARELLDKESAQIDRLLKNLDRASVQLSATMDKAGGTMDKANGALDQLQTAAQTANSTFATANDTFTSANRAINDIHEPLKKDLAEMQQTMIDARRMIGDLDTVVAGNRYNINDTLENFRAASENLRDLTLSVKQRPWSLFRGKAAPDRAVPVIAGKP
jgi:phospholipid/cholesterol/gamma-HCH transport system substrate-binding protein